MFGFIVQVEIIEDSQEGGRADRAKATIIKPHWSDSNRVEPIRISKETDHIQKVLIYIGSHKCKRLLISKYVVHNIRPPIHHKKTLQTV